MPSAGMGRSTSITGGAGDLPYAAHRSTVANKMLSHADDHPVDVSKRHRPLLRAPHLHDRFRQDDRAAFLRRSAGRLALLLLVTAGIAGIAMPPSIPRWYFFHQDLWLLAIDIVALAGLSLIPGCDREPVLPRGTLFAAIGVAAVVAYGGSWLLLDHYPLSRDESLADLATSYFAHGRLGQRIPTTLAPLAVPMMPLWADGWIDRGWWVSPYLPGNSILRAGAAWIGDRWLAGPALLAVGAVALRASARRVWPARPEAATVALALALTSSQVLLMAMTAYAMTAHFALNALWLWCFLRGGRTGHAAAMTIGFAAVGLHQLQFHLIFASGFVIWLFRTGQGRLALAYCAALAGSLVAWKIGYAHVLAGALGTSTAPVALSQPLQSWTVSIGARLTEWQPINSLARFAAWQNVLLLPLAALGARPEKDAAGHPTIFWAMRFSCAFGLVTMVYQGHGYGYRYLHHLLPCFCLLAAQGWIAWNERHPDARWGAPLLWGSAIVAICGTIPLCFWMAHAFVHPYAAAYRLAKSAPADVVLVDARGAAFVQDIVRIDDPLTRPLLLDLAVVEGDQLVALCRHRRVMILDEHQTRALGLLPPLGREEPAAPFASRRALLDRLRCGRPVPMPR